MYRGEASDLEGYEMQLDELSGKLSMMKEELASSNIEKESLSEEVARSKMIQSELQDEIDTLRSLVKKYKEEASNSSQFSRTENWATNSSYEHDRSRLPSRRLHGCDSGSVSSEIPRRSSAAQ